MTQIKAILKDNTIISKEVACDCNLKRAHDLHPELPLKFGCRRGDCGVCAIRVVEGMENLTRRTKQEEIFMAKKKLPAEYRLACQCSLNGGGGITIGPKPS